MIPRVVTTAGPVWESDLVDRARATGTLRIVKRAFHPEPVYRTLAEGRAGAVVVGAGIPWLSSGLVAAWRRMGAVVIGIDDPCHPPSRGLLEDWGSHIVLEEPDPEWAAASLAAMRPTPADSSNSQAPTLVAVGGPRGAPGRTEVALGIAWLAARSGSCLLIEADTSPALGLRLGVPPPAEPHQVVTVGQVDLLLWDPRGSSGGMLRNGWSRLWDYRTAVVDLGPGMSAFGDWPGQRVVVCRASPPGIVRTASLLARLGGGPPSHMVINRLPPGDPLGGEISRHLASLTGAQPAAWITELDDLEWGTPPPPSIQAALEPLMARLDLVDGPSTGSPVTPQHPQAADRNQVRLEHRSQPLRPRGVDQIDKEPVAPCLMGRTGLDPGEVGPPGGQLGEGQRQRPGPVENLEDH
nr:hypothetical protein [bacterium]